MRRSQGSRLLQGAATKKTSIAVTIGAAILAALWAAPLTAQKPQAESTTVPSLNVAILYSALRAPQVPNTSFWMQGGSIQVEGSFYRGLGAVADVTRLHVANINSSGVGLDLVTATFGPRYTWTRPRYGIFAQMLVGDAIGFNSVFPFVTGANTTASSLALKAGGGINVRLTPHLALRAIEADWMRTQLPNSTTNVQNSLNLGAGAVFRFR
jgi:hypothetical protein